jgi:hypothetical protein
MIYNNNDVFLALAKFFTGLSKVSYLAKAPGREQKGDLAHYGQTSKKEERSKNNISSKVPNLEIVNIMGPQYRSWGRSSPGCCWSVVVAFFPPHRTFSTGEAGLGLVKHHHRSSKICKPQPHPYRTMPSSTPTPPPKSFLPLDALFENPVFAGGIGLAGLGAALVFARKQTVKGASLLKRRLLVNLEISKQDDSYPYVNALPYHPEV